MIDNIFLDPNWKIRGKSDDEIIGEWEREQRLLAEEAREAVPPLEYIAAGEHPDGDKSTDGDTTTHRGGYDPLPPPFSPFIHDDHYEGLH